MCITIKTGVGLQNVIQHAIQITATAGESAAKDAQWPLSVCGLNGWNHHQACGIQHEARFNLLDKPGGVDQALDLIEFKHPGHAHVSRLG